MRTLADVCDLIAGRRERLEPRQGADPRGKTCQQVVGDGERREALELYALLRQDCDRIAVEIEAAEAVVGRVQPQLRRHYEQASALPEEVEVWMMKGDETRSC